MFDQSFSADNFRKILDYENRKGKNLEAAFFPEVFKITKEIGALNKKAKIKLPEDDYKSLCQLKKDLKQKKEILLQAELDRVSNNVLDSGFTFDLKKIEIKNKKPFYTIKKTPEVFFLMKQLQRNVLKLYKVKQADRTAIINQLKCILGDGFPKYVIRTDIEGFYESIPHYELLRKVSENNLLTFVSKRFIRQILTDYKAKSASDNGIPRGIGVSAYLSEIYMRHIDEKIRSLPNVTYYARYVDDIIIVFTPTPVNNVSTMYLDDIQKIVENDKLKLNIHGKTREFDLRNTVKYDCLEYLGYRIFFGNGDIQILLSRNKIDKYKKRIALSLNAYKHDSRVDEKKARQLLVKRIRFLTGNTRLQGNKNNILVGIYYSHDLLTQIDDFNGLDSYLNYKIDLLIKSDSLKMRLKKMTFTEGFASRRFSPFNTHELTEIIHPWENIG